MDDYGSYYGWNVQNLSMLPQKFKLTIRKVKSKDGMIDDPGVRKQLDIIKALFDEATENIVATDAGREEELSFFILWIAAASSDTAGDTANSRTVTPKCANHFDTISFRTSNRCRPNLWPHS